MKKTLILTATEKNNPKAKRFILKKSEDLEELRALGREFTRFNIVVVYNTKWEVVETIA